MELTMNGLVKCSFLYTQEVHVLHHVDVVKRIAVLRV